MEWGWGSRFLSTKPWEPWASPDGASRWASGLGSGPMLGVPTCLPLQPLLSGWPVSPFLLSACMHAQSRLTLFDPMDCSPPGFSVREISQARILEWVAISFSRGLFQPRYGTRDSCIGRHWQADSLPLSHQGSPCCTIPDN